MRACQAANPGTAHAPEGQHRGRRPALAWAGGRRELHHWELVQVRQHEPWRGKSCGSLLQLHTEGWSRARARQRWHFLCSIEFPEAQVNAVQQSGCCAFVCFGVITGSRSGFEACHPSITYSTSAPSWGGLGAHKFHLFQRELIRKMQPSTPHVLQLVMGIYFTA